MKHSIIRSLTFPQLIDHWATLTSVYKIPKSASSKTLGDFDDDYRPLKRIRFDDDFGYDEPEFLLLAPIMPAEFAPPPRVSTPASQWVYTRSAEEQKNYDQIFRAWRWEHRLDQLADRARGVWAYSGLPEGKLRRIQCVSSNSTICLLIIHAVLLAMLTIAQI